MEESPYRGVLKRVGVVLVLVALADVGWMIYCFIHGMPYSSSLNLFAVAAGVFLIRGSLRTATYVRWFSIFFLSGCGLRFWLGPQKDDRLREALGGKRWRESHPN
jgi:hypothetical protein